ncbi:MAG: hypothetical protein IPK60_13535 [Sandaracinaceae bacterium]|nr:hypothetical protein [Sandaracinaceae bacterium]
MQNRATIERVGDAVQGLNDETRWGKTTLAADRVVPAFREQFLVNHEGWGSRIQIAECDLVSLRLGEDEASATSIMNISWYRSDTMEVAQSTLRQTWQEIGRNFALIEEEVVSGDESIFTRYPADEETSGGEIVADLPSGA